MRPTHLPKRTRLAHHAAWAALLLGGILGSASAFGAAPATDESVKLADLAVKANPGLAAVGTRITALRERVRGAGAWHDPVVSLSYQNMPVDRWAPGASPMSGIQVALKQTFFWPGKMAARERETEALVAEERETLAERKVQLRALVQRAYYRLALVRHLRQVTEAHLKLLGQLIDVVRVKYEVGKVGQHELLRLQVLRAKLDDDLQSFAQDDQSFTAAINAALHRETATPIATPDRIVPPPAPRDVAPLVERAVAHRPLLKRYLAEAAARRATASRLSREQYPDITTWLGYTFRTEAGADPGTDFVSLGVSVPLPFTADRRWGTKARESVLRARVAEEARASELDRIRGELARAVAVWQRAAQKAATYRQTLMPQAHRTLDATFAAYQVDRADFASLFQAELQLLDFERTIRQAEAQAALARIEVDALIGQSPTDR